MQKLTLSICEAATLLGIGRSTIYRAMQRSELPYRKIGRRTLILRRDIDVLLAANSGDKGGDDDGR